MTPQRRHLDVPEAHFLTGFAGRGHFGPGPVRKWSDFSTFEREYNLLVPPEKCPRPGIRGSVPTWSSHTPLRNSGSQRVKNSPFGAFFGSHRGAARRVRKGTFWSRAGSGNGQISPNLKENARGRSPYLMIFRRFGENRLSARNGGIWCPDRLGPLKGQDPKSGDPNRQRQHPTDSILPTATGEKLSIRSVFRFPPGGGPEGPEGDILVPGRLRKWSDFSKFERECTGPVPLFNDISEIR